MLLYTIVAQVLYNSNFIQCCHHLFYVYVISLFAIRECQNFKKFMKIININEKNLHTSERLKTFQS